MTLGNNFYDNFYVKFYDNFYVKFYDNFYDNFLILKTPRIRHNSPEVLFS